MLLNALVSRFSSSPALQPSRPSRPSQFPTFLPHLHVDDLPSIGRGVDDQGEDIITTYTQMLYDDCFCLGRSVSKPCAKSGHEPVARRRNAGRMRQ